MRFMMFMLPAETDETKWTPGADDVSKMMAYNEELTKAGVLLALDGLQPTSKGARVTFSGGKRQRHRRPVRGGQGGHRRLLDHPGQVQGGGRRVGVALPRRRRRHDRGAPGLRDGRLPPGRPGRGVALADAAGADLGLGARGLGDAQRHRRRLADRVAAADRRPRADGARRRPRRGPGPGRARRRAGAVARVGRPGQPGRLAHGHREAPRDRPAAPQRAPSSASRRSSAATCELAARRLEPQRRRRRRRRPAPPGLHRLPPGALDRRARAR